MKERKKFIDKKFSSDNTIIIQIIDIQRLVQLEICRAINKPKRSF